MITRGVNQTRGSAGLTAPVEAGSTAAKPLGSSRAKTRKHPGASRPDEILSSVAQVNPPKSEIGGAAALAQERRRIAADVHDLILQDLTLAVANARTLANEPDPSHEASVILEAGERALTAARQLVDGLVEADRRPIQDAVESSVRTAARSIPLTFSASGVPARARPDRQTCDTLVHVAREAVTNAVKHGSPRSLDVRLEFDQAWRLTVRDDGAGFDRDAVPRGFGLESMRRQAEALGGSLRVVSVPGSGTIVDAVLP